MHDTITLRYARIRANELRSPVQFGQATRFEIAGGDNIVAGVTDPHLADDVFLEYSRIINRNTYLTAGVSASVPARGWSLRLTAIYRYGGAGLSTLLSITERAGGPVPVPVQLNR